MTAALVILLMLLVAAKYHENRRLKRRIVRFQTRERAYRRMGELMALRPEPVEETSRLMLVEGEAS